MQNKVKIRNHTMDSKWTNNRKYEYRMIKLFQTILIITVIRTRYIMYTGDLAK